MGINGCHSRKVKLLEWIELSVAVNRIYVNKTNVILMPLNRFTYAEFFCGCEVESLARVKIEIAKMWYTSSWNVWAEKTCCRSEFTKCPTLSISLYQNRLQNLFNYSLETTIPVGIMVRVFASGSEDQGTIQVELYQKLNCTWCHFVLHSAF